MAITLGSRDGYPSGFVTAGYTADATNTEIVVAAPGAGKAITVRKMAINTLAAEIIAVGDGEAGGNIETAFMSAIYTGATSTVNLEFDPPWVLTANKPLTLQAGGAGETVIVVSGVIVDV